MKDVREALMVGRNTEGKLVRRPLSPFMLGSDYRPQMSSMTSILHRITGCALGVGTLLLTIWLVCAASGDSAFSVIQAVLASWIGLRHLAWDAGKGFELPTMHRSGAFVFAATVILTVGFWAIALYIW
jgi:succinate dehydrogenase / fumarate reductase, cytochrome b subunit